MKLQNRIRLLIGTIVLAGALSAAAADKKVLVVTASGPGGFRHSSIPIAENVLGTLAERTGLFTVEYARTPEEVISKMTLEGLKKFDAVIFANTTLSLPIPDKDAFMGWIRSGKGFAGMHSASDTFHDYPPFIEMLGGEFNGHGPQVEVDVYVEDREHPACQHWGHHFKIYDEIYLFKNFSREKVHGLLNQHTHPNDKIPGDYPIAWCKKYGKGNVFYTSLGHREDVWTSANYQKHILGGIKFVLGLEKGNTTPQSKEAVLTPAERKEGFRSLFNGTSLKGWKLRQANGKPSWTVQNGMLVNAVAKNDHGTDLLTEEAFRDFTVRYEYLVPSGSNSGLYLRGRHEIQIFDEGAKDKPEPGGNGAIYNVKPVAMFASRKAGQWQEAEVTIRGNKVSAILNGVKIHNNIEVNKATGGELDANLEVPGPILLQGDHGSIAFRNIRIKPLK